MIDVTGVVVTMATGSSQVFVQDGGEVRHEANDTVHFVCPKGSRFRDIVRGLYGTGSVASLDQRTLKYSYPRRSRLDFVCDACADGFYALVGGTSTGAPGQASNPPCTICPFGGRCRGGLVAASSGFWGAVITNRDEPTTSPASGNASSLLNATVLFLQCPNGYCCGTRGMECTTVDGCNGNRGGRLCGHCLPGYGEQMSSPVCKLRAECKDWLWLWPLGVMLLVVIASFMLKSSGVWCPKVKRSVGRIKLMSYFYQVGSSYRRVCSSFGASLFAFPLVFESSVLV